MAEPTAPAQPCCGCDSPAEPGDCECTDYCPHSGPCRCACHGALLATSTLAEGPPHACGADPDDVCPDCSRPSEEPDPVADERAAIVAWLRADQPIAVSMIEVARMRKCANAIERGEHRKERK